MQNVYTKLVSVVGLAFVCFIMLLFPMGAFAQVPDCCKAVSDKKSDEKVLEEPGLDSQIEDMQDEDIKKLKGHLDRIRKITQGGATKRDIALLRAALQDLWVFTRENRFRIEWLEDDILMLKDALQKEISDREAAVETVNGRVDYILEIIIPILERRIEKLESFMDTGGWADLYLGVDAGGIFTSRASGGKVFADIGANIMLNQNVHLVLAGRIGGAFLGSKESTLTAGAIVELRFPIKVGEKIFFIPVVGFETIHGVYSVGYRSFSANLAEAGFDVGFLDGALSLGLRGGVGGIDWGQGSELVGDVSVKLSALFW